ncbi:type III secretion system chaperone family protein [Janibacter indicus]|uniref:Putative sensory transduction regulator n=1 Tax=Janibacter indicus TaxID=857417 RepID=A0A1W2BL93_9MICO|nr:YbjN domain-containing protein [Janibacter indicus]SMC73661.1 Putative sensory transduction regulator [Janibacter indicus]
MTEQTDREQALAVVRRTVEDADLEHEGGARDGELVVTLPGEKKLKTVVSLLVGEQALSVSAFVIRNADENHEEFYRHLLRRNLRMPLLAYSIDASGDVYVGGRIPLRAVTEELVDQVLGVVLDAADAPFNELLLLGFRSSMQKEWDWRVSRGESLRNLEAFRSVLEHTDGSTPE